MNSPASSTAQSGMGVPPMNPDQPQLDPPSTPSTASVPVRARPCSSIPSIPSIESIIRPATPPLTVTAFRQLPIPDALITLNRVRLARGLHAISYALLATHFGASKSTIGAVIAGTYHAGTAARIRGQIREHLASLYRDLYPEPALPAEAVAKAGHSQISNFRSPRTPRTPRIHRARVTPEGYFRFRDHHYYAGSLFAGLVVTVAPIRGDRNALRITLGLTTRTLLAPIDPEGNQLNYVPREARHA